MAAVVGGARSHRHLSVLRGGGLGVAGREEGVVDEVKNFMAGIGRALRADLKATLPASFLR